ncbi:hypothetical protein D3C72_359930 [compost metagenome]
MKLAGLFELRLVKYGAVPPEGIIVIVPSSNPSQVSGVPFTIAVSATAGCVTVIFVRVTSQPFWSFTFIE